MNLPPVLNRFKEVSSPRPIGIDAAEFGYEYIIVIPDYVRLVQYAEYDRAAQKTG